MLSCPEIYSNAQKVGIYDGFMMRGDYWKDVGKARTEELGGVSVTPHEVICNLCIKSLAKCLKLTTKLRLPFHRLRAEGRT